MELLPDGRQWNSVGRFTYSVLAGLVRSRLRRAEEILVANGCRQRTDSLVRGEFWILSWRRRVTVRCSRPRGQEAFSRPVVHRAPAATERGHYGWQTVKS